MVLNETHCLGLMSPSWECEADLQHTRRAILLYWTCTLSQQLQANILSQRMRVGSTLREFARVKEHPALFSFFSKTPFYQTVLISIAKLKMAFGVFEKIKIGA